MKINLKKISPRTIFFNEILKEWLPKFAKEYDIDLKDSHMYLMTEVNGKEHFSNFLKTNNVLNMRAYELKNDDGTTFITGFDIEEDSLYTVALLKYTHGEPCLI